MNINTAYPSAYLKADDLNGRAVTVTIDRVEMEEIGQGRNKETKPVIYFRGKEKGLVCNKTNANTIAKLYGGETDEWAGKGITIRPAEVEYQGEMMIGIRVSPMKPGGAAVPAKATAAPAPKPTDPDPSDEPAPEEDDNSIPF